jgi:hypothetical protein
MKKYLITCLILLIGTLFFPKNVLAQEDYDKNVFKLQVTPLLYNTYGVQYERMLSSRISLAVSGGYMPSLSSFLKDQLDVFIDDDKTVQDVQSLEMKSFSITPEVRFYVGKKNGPRGFYLAPYLNYSVHDLNMSNFNVQLDYEDVPEDYQGELSRNFNLSGNIKGVTGGLLLGAQFKLGKAVYLDWWILGASYGSGKGKLDVLSTVPLTQEWQDAVQERVDEIDVPMLKIESKVSANGLHSNLSGPWAAVRGGLSLGIKF